MSPDLSRSTDRDSSGPRTDCRHTPALTDLLRRFGLDVDYHRAVGDCVYYRDGSDEEIEVLDAVGGYGALLLGHAHPQLIHEAARWLSSGQANHVQGSLRTPAAALAEMLAARTGRDDCAVFANTGAEAVEAALKHAMLETGGRTFITIEGGFHGKTLAALQLSASPEHQDFIARPGIRVVRVAPDDRCALEHAFQRADNLAGLIFEPILGEGGVHPLDSGFVRRAAELCNRYNVPLIADECQTGLGRTGSILASQALGVEADYVILSKVLGGGLAKISALLINRRRYRHEFDRLHTSTFAADGFSCALSLKTLELLDDDLISACHTKGMQLFSRLRQLQSRHPDVIADVRGRGLMLGVDFHPQNDSPSLLLRAMTTRRSLGLLIAGSLLKQQRVRVAPTLSAPLTLRIQPSALISDPQIDWLVDALDQTCDRLARHDVQALTAHLDPQRGDGDAPAPDRMQPDEPVVTFHSHATHHRRDDAPPRRMAWLFHLVDANDLPSFEPEFEAVDVHERAAYLERVAPLAEPVVMHPVNVRSRLGGAVQVHPLLLPVTSDWMKRMLAERKHSVVRGLVQHGVRIAESLDCDVASLGQFTSIVSRNGCALESSGIGLTTGNSYTAALVIEAVRTARFEDNSSPADKTLAIVGASGNIGRACAEILAPDYQRVILIGRETPLAKQQLRDIGRGLPNAEVSCDLRDARWADVVVCVTNGITPLLMPEDFKESAVVVDAAIPRAVQPTTCHQRPDVRLIQGGVVRLPFGEDLRVPGFPLPPGQAFGCMAEGVLLALEGIRDTAFTGRLAHDRIAHIADLARRHGFKCWRPDSDRTAENQLASVSEEQFDVCHR